MSLSNTFNLKTELPFVSICLLTYNRGSELPKTLDSLLAQTHSGFELIINDDRSPDNTEAICREYEKKDPRVKYFKNETNLRYADNQNAAIDRANSDYVAIVHDGDVYRADLIEKWTLALVDAPKAGLVFNAYRAILPSGGEINHLQELPPVSSGRVLLETMLTRLDSPIFGIVMVRKSAVLAVGLFDRRFPTLADIDMWMRLLNRCDVAYVSEPLIDIHPREKGHHNNPGNIKVRQQLEHIYLLNAGRAYADRVEVATRVRKHLESLLRRRNWRSFFWCLKHGRLKQAMAWPRFIWATKARHMHFWEEGFTSK